MAKIKFNNDVNTYPITGFNRNSTFTDGVMTSYAYVNLNAIPSVASALQAYGISGIDSIKIYDDNDELMYNLDNIDGQVAALDETLSGTSIQITMNIEVKTIEQQAGD